MRAIITHTRCMVNWEQVFEIKLFTVNPEHTGGLHTSSSLDAYGHSVYFEEGEAKRSHTQIYAGSYAGCWLVLDKIASEIAAKDSSGVFDVLEFVGTPGFAKREKMLAEEFEKVDRDA